LQERLSDLPVVFFNQRSDVQMRSPDLVELLNDGASLFLFLCCRSPVKDNGYNVCNLPAQLE
jgi:hypothetical protein